METKKNPKKDLTRNSGLHFVCGLAVVLMLTYVALEWKMFYGDYDGGTCGMIDEENITEEPIVIKLPLPSKPKAIITPPVIEILPDEEEAIETVIDAVEPDQDTKIADVGDIDVAEIPEDIDVDFIRVEKVPVFPGCEKKVDKRACFNEMMSKHIRKNFRYPEIAQEMGIEGKVYIRFVIQKDGSIGNIQMQSPDKNLELEAARIIDKLPKMTPGKQRGTPVRVPFNLPLTFKLSN